MFFIHTGQVNITRGTSGGEKVLATLGEGGFFGEMVLTGAVTTRAATAKTLTEVMILELNQDAFEALTRRSPEIAMTIIKVLTERLRDSNGKISALMHKNDFVRVANYLNFMANEKSAPAPSQKPGRVFVLKTAAAGSAIGVEPDDVQNFVNLAHKARMLGQNGEWIWVPYPQYLIPFGEYLANK